jgi:DNA-binding MarR family transcriptional regulator
MNRFDAEIPSSEATRFVRRAETELVLDEFVPYLLNQVTSRLNLRMQQHLRTHRVSVPHWRVLCLLTLQGPLSIGAIVASTVIAQSTLSRVVDQLERRELVERRLRPSNNRVVEVHLTKEGRRLFKRILPAALDVRDRLVSPLSASEHRQLRRVLQKLLGQLRHGENGHA